MDLSRVVAWLLGRGPVTTVESEWSKTEIIKRVTNGLGEQAAAASARGALGRTVDSFKSGGTAGYVDGGWYGRWLNLWWHPAGGSAGLAANLRITFDSGEPDAGARMSAQVRFAPMFIPLLAGVSLAGLLMALGGVVLAALGLGVVVLVIGVVLLGAGLTNIVAQRARLGSDVAMLWQFWQDRVGAGVAETPQ